MIFQWLRVIKASILRAQEVSRREKGLSPKSRPGRHDSALGIHSEGRALSGIQYIRVLKQGRNPKRFMFFRNDLVSWMCCAVSLRGALANAKAVRAEAQTIFTEQRHAKQVFHQGLGSLEL